MASVTTQLSNNRAIMRVTIADMAQALGLTKSTVSRALNGYPDISSSTKLRVERMAEKMNYQPLSHAQAIKTGRTRSLGLVLQLSDHDAHRPFLAEFLAGISAGASAKGYTLTVASADNHEHLIETFRALLRDGKADGFVLPRVMSEDPRVELLRHADVPFVLYGRIKNADGCCWYDIRGEDAMRDAVLHLAGLGHRHIGFINGGTQYSYADIRLQGYMQGMRAANLTTHPDLISQNAVTLQEGQESAKQFLNSGHPVTAIVCATDVAALGVYHAAAEQGVKIGENLSVIGYDGIQEGAHVYPPLTTFAVDNRAAGVQLSTLLIQRITGEPLENLRITAPASFLQRGSTQPPPHHRT
ncbi:MAG: LacI family DNA-binding transcriptional regulator [Roseobacter sp.]